MNRFFIVAVCSLVLFSSCHFFGGKHIKGTGNVKKEDRTGNHKFSSIEVENALELHVRQDSAYSINIETDENLLQYIIVENNGDQLTIRTERNANLDPSNGNKVKIYVSLPAIKGLKASGACSIIGENTISSNEKLAIDLSGASDAELQLKAPKISIDMSGASGISLGGETKDLAIEATGACHAECFGLSSENADVDVSGASSAEVFASVKIDASASGASNVKCKGKGTLKKDESGASSVEKVD
jgi:hypothetical protein